MNTGDRKVMNRAVLVLLIVVAAFVLLLLVAGKNGTKSDDFGQGMTTDTNTNKKDPSENLKQAVINIDNNLLVARVADSESARERGMSGTHFLNEQSGMWFVFEEADQHGFWMKDTKFALDIAWVDSFGVIVHMEQNIKPETYPKIFTPPVPAQYVLEVSSGYFERNDIKIGDTIHVTPIKP